MAAPDSLAEMHRQLDALEQEMDRVRQGASGGEAEQAEALRVRAHAEALRRRLHATNDDDWQQARDEIEAEWHSLTDLVRRWGATVDRRFARPQGGGKP